MAPDTKWRTKRLGRVPEAVYDCYRANVGEGISDTTLISDVLAVLGGRSDLAEKLVTPEDIAPLFDPAAIRGVAEAIEQARKQAAVPTHPHLSAGVEFTDTAEDSNEAYAKAS